MWRYEVVKVSRWSSKKELKLMLDELGRRNWLLVTKFHNNLLFVRPDEPPKVRIIFGKPQPIPKGHTHGL